MSPGGRPDVLVVGAGPAGSAAAAFLAERGVRVMCIERAAFPRPKPCAEYLSPQTEPILRRLGVLRAIVAERPARLTGMRICGPDGTAFEGRFRGRRCASAPVHGLALPRERFDFHLATAAAGRGAELRERTVLDGLTRDRRGGVTAVIRTGGRRATVRPHIIIGADGLNSRVARWLNLTRRGVARRIALVTHMAPVAGMGDLGEMHVVSGAYLGLAPVGNGITNVAVVVSARGLPRNRPVSAVFDRALSRFPAVTRRLADARRLSPIRAVGPFARWTPRATANAALLVGDAADFYDPFTGEGIFAALAGAEFAAHRVRDALERGDFTAPSLVGYDRDRRRAFGGKWMLERLVAAAVATPALFNYIARRLRARTYLADTLVSVTGNLLPASRVLRPSFVWNLIR